MAEGNGRRYPNNLQGLLRFCTENTKTEDASGATPMQPMTDERRQWLTEAMEAMQGNDPIKIMMKDVQVLLADQEDIEEQEQALEDLHMYCEDIDLANDFHKIGGSHILPRLLASPHEGLRWRVADLIAALTQNNPIGQRAVLETNLMPLLLRILDDTKEVELVRVKALYAVSCLVRECPEAEAEFMKQDGFSYLLRAMQSDVEKLRVKSTFMISALCQETPNIKDVLCDMGMVEQIVGLLLTEHSSFHEHLMKALLCLVSSHERARAECHRPEFHLKQLLDERRVLISAKPEYQEELEYVNELYIALGYDQSQQQSTSLAER